MLLTPVEQQAATFISPPPVPNAPSASAFKSSGQRFLLRQTLNGENGEANVTAIGGTSLRSRVH